MIPIRRSTVAALYLLALCAALGYAVDGPGIDETRAASPWLTASTEHFTFVYQEIDAGPAATLLEIAEGVYDRVTGLLGSYPDHVTVVVDGFTDISNGAYTGGPPHHISLTLASPELPWFGSRSASWLEFVLTHEFTHFVQGNYAPGLMHTAGRIFGETANFVSLEFAPLWYVEGLAVASETLLTSGGRGSDPFFLNEFRVAAASGSLPTLFQAGYDSYRPPYARPYSTGYMIWDGLIDEFGVDVVQDILAEFARFPFFGIWGPIRRVTGHPMREIYPIIAGRVASRAAADLSASATPATRRISPEGSVNYYLPSRTARGLYLYRTNPRRLPAIVSFDPESGEERIVLEEHLTDQSSWTVTEDGGTIYFATYDAEFTSIDGGSIRSNIFRYDVDTRTITRVTADGGYAHPAVSADGTRLVATRGVEDRRSLVAIPLAREGSDGSSEPLLDLSDTSFYTPSISPDGSRAVVAFSRDGVQRLMLIDLLDGQLAVLPTGSTDTAPHYPRFEDDHTIVYSLDEQLHLSVYRHDLTSNTRRLIASDGLSSYGAIRYDGRLIVGRYGARGYVLDIQDEPAGTGAEQMPPPIQVTELPESRPRPIPEGEAYRAIPRPVLWWPSIGLLTSPIEFSGYGFGATVLGQDVLQRNRWQVTGHYYPWLSQGDATAEFSRVAGRWTWGLGADIGYRIALTESGATYRELSTQSVTASYSLANRYELGVQRALGLNAGVTNVAGFSSADPFTLGEALGTFGDGSIGAYTLSGVGASYFRGRSAPVGTYYSAGSVDMDLQLTAALPYVGGLHPGIIVDADGYASTGILGSNNIVALSGWASYATHLDWQHPIEYRGFGQVTPVSASETLPGTAVIRAEYHTPLLLTDLALGPRVGLIGAGITLFAESGGRFTPSAFGLAAEGSVVVGAEILSMLNVGVEIPLRIGVAYRWTPVTPSAPEYGRNLVVYLR